MTPSFLLLAVGLLFGLWDAALGIELNQGAMDTLRKRLSFGWRARRATIIGALLVISSVVVQATGH